ncbi:hypothetical protein [Daejeonella sp.]
MDVFDEELFRFWKIAFEDDLKYIMIGGVATNLHGYHDLRKRTYAIV